MTQVMILDHSGRSPACPAWCSVIFFINRNPNPNPNPNPNVFTVPLTFQVILPDLAMSQRVRRLLAGLQLHCAKRCTLDMVDSLILLWFARACGCAIRTSRVVPKMHRSFHPRRPSMISNEAHRHGVTFTISVIQVLRFLFASLMPSRGSKQHRPVRGRWARAESSQSSRREPRCEHR
jgi:hypothetical protein